jgi:hypothetical protein
MNHVDLLGSEASHNSFKRRLAALAFADVAGYS